MPVVYANLGPLFLPSPGGPIRWRPTGPLYRVSVRDGVRGNPPKVERLGAETFSARIFVGFNVGETPTWTLDELIAVAKRHWKKAKWSRRKKETSGASFLSQRGFFDSPQGFVSEDSAQVVIVSGGTESEFPKFQKAMEVFSEAITKDLKQQAVLLELQVNGLTRLAAYVSEGELETRLPAKRTKRK